MQLAASKIQAVRAGSSQRWGMVVDEMGVLVAVKGLSPLGSLLYLRISPIAITSRKM